MAERVDIAGLRVDKDLYDFVVNEAIPGTGVDAATFWAGLGAIVNDLAPKNRELLAKRDSLQEKLDGWYKAKRESGYSADEYQAFLKEIGYLLPEGDAFKVSTTNVDPEIAVTAGPQLVVPVMNARYALNAANARWGSLYDALYGTDAIPEVDGAEKGKGYNPRRGEKVIAWAKDFLDASAPLASGSWAAVAGLSVVDGGLAVKFADGAATALKDGAQFVGYKGDAAAPSAVLARSGTPPAAASTAPVAALAAALPPPRSRRVQRQGQRGGNAATWVARRSGRYRPPHSMSIEGPCSVWVSRFGPGAGGGARLAAAFAT